MDQIDSTWAAIIALVATILGVVLREGAQLILKLTGKTNGSTHHNPGNGKYVRKDVCEERHKLVETRLDEAKTQREQILSNTAQTQADVRMLTRHLLEND